MKSLNKHDEHVEVSTPIGLLSGWPQFILAFLVAVAVHLGFNNAVASLTSGILVLYLSTINVLSTLLSVGIALFIGGSFGYMLYEDSKRWDFGVALGVFLAFVVYRVFSHNALKLKYRL